MVTIRKVNASMVTEAQGALPAALVSPHLERGLDSIVGTMF